MSLGSNLGNRLEYLRAVVEALERGPLLAVRGVSGVYETAPIEPRLGKPARLPVPMRSW